MRPLQKAKGQRRDPEDKPPFRLGRIRRWIWWWRRGGGCGTQAITLAPQVTKVEIESKSLKAVFGLPELLEKILDYVIQNADDDHRSKILGVLRLVQKNWMTAVTTVMRYKEEPLFNLTLTKDNSFNGTPVVDAQGNLLDQFVGAVDHWNGVQFPPTFSLKVMEGFFHKENYDSLATCLKKCGEGLLELSLVIPENGGSFPCIFPQVELPFLQKLTVQVTKRLAANFLRSEVAFDHHSTNVICLLQSLLSKTVNLTKFVIPGSLQTNQFPLPPGIEYVALPESISHLELECKMRNDDLELLVKNELPNLIYCKMALPNCSLNEGILGKMMTNFCKSLKDLRILRYEAYCGPPRKVNYVVFPVMEKLENLSLGSNGLELETGHGSLRDCFPCLKHLRLFEQTPEMLRKWTTSSSVKSVKRLTVCLVDENKSEKSRDYTLPINEDSMQGIHYSFPNVRKLSLMLSGGLTCGLKYLFVEMGQLVFLSIEVFGSHSVNSSDYWDSVLIGAPDVITKGLRENPDYWRNVELKDEVPSIRMLTALRTLTLQAFVESSSSHGGRQPLISDLSFTLALLKMPQLKQLNLGGRFLASEEMATQWKLQGRIITYTSL